MTRQPNALWITLQLREAWGYDQSHRFLIFDRDSKFSADVISAVRQHGAEPVRTAFPSVITSKAANSYQFKTGQRPTTGVAVSGCGAGERT